MHVLEHCPGRHRIVHRLIHRNILEFLSVYAEVRNSLRRLRSLHTLHVPAPRRHESRKMPIRAAHVQQFPFAASIFQVLQETLLP